MPVLIGAGLDFAYGAKGGSLIQALPKPAFFSNSWVFQNPISAYIAGGKFAL